MFYVLLNITVSEGKALNHFSSLNISNKILEHATFVWWRFVRSLRVRIYKVACDLLKLCNMLWRFFVCTMHCHFLMFPFLQMLQKTRKLMRWCFAIVITASVSMNWITCPKMINPTMRELILWKCMRKLSHYMVKKIYNFFSQINQWIDIWTFGLLLSASARIDSDTSR